MTQMQRGKSAQSRVRVPRFTIRTLLGLIALTSLSIVAFQFAWPRRTVRTSVLSPLTDVSVFEPHLAQIKASSKTLGKLEVDHATNTIVIHAQARNIEAARNEIELLVENPSALLASASLGITLQEARNLVDGQ